MNYPSVLPLSSLSKLAVSLLLLIAAVFNINAAVPDEVQAVFVNNGCLNCHGATNPSGGLSLVNADVSEMQLVDVNANCNANMKRVLAGEPQNSALYRKISMQNPGCGGVMPPNGNMISQADQAVIFDWIVSIGPAAQFGLIEMQTAAVTVQETDTNLTLTVNRLLGTQGQVSVDYVVSTIGTDTATSPDDYVADSGTLVFADGETSQTITILLADDDVFEGAEVFSATLSNVAGGAVLGSQAQTKVTIQDNEMSNEPGTFLFSAVNYSVVEDAGTIDITVLRSFGAAGSVSVELRSTDVTAVSNMDYTSINQTLVFDEGIRSQVVSLAILDDQTEEESERLTLSLSNPAGGAVLGSPNNVTVTINDNDAPDVVVVDPEPETPIVPTTEATYEAAGAIFYLIPMIGILFFVFRGKKR
ncbi:Calx-beta domain-containing protein [Aliikangiella sp. IMCC44359]|uniref:Calx-beta domain-containing protein n=1 Tax=Aliikangiella sp. IMCC44359 TaxID=3459125 RepID=UPI00403AA235